MLLVLSLVLFSVHRLIYLECFDSGSDLGIVKIASSPAPPLIRRRQRSKKHLPRPENLELFSLSCCIWNFEWEYFT